MNTCPPDLARKIAADIANEERAVKAARIAGKWRDLGAHLANRDAVPVRPFTLAEMPNASLGRAWAEDVGWVQDTVEQLDISDGDRAFAASAQGEFLSLCKERTGEECDLAALDTYRRRAAAMLEQSHILAERMSLEPDPAAVTDLLADCIIAAASAGADALATAAAYLPTAREIAPRFDAYRNTNFSLWRYYVHSGHTEKIPNFRRLAFIPYVAQGIRAPLVSALEFWLSKRIGARFWTFTTGKRVPLNRVRERHEWLCNRLRLLNAETFMKSAGVEIVFRSTELGTPEMDKAGKRLHEEQGGKILRDEAGNLTFHVHAHCVAELKKGFIGGDSNEFGPDGKRLTNWQALLARVHRFWGYQWKDGGEGDDDGPIRNVRELVKYVTKPGEMLKLTGAELVALQSELSRAKLVQPMGSLAAEMKARAAADLRLCRKRTPDGGRGILYEVQNWNKHTRRTAAEKTQDAAESLKPADARGSQRIVSRCVPGFGPCGISEPRVIVMATEWDERAVRRDPAVSRLIEVTAPKFWAARIKVHTRTPTVGTSAEFGFVETLPCPRHIPSGAELAGLTR